MQPCTRAANPQPDRISKFTTRFKDTWDWICARYKWDCHVAFGPADSRVAWDKNGHEGWGFTGHAEVWDRLCGLFAAGAPRHLSLGAGWAFFFLRPDGRWSLSDPEGCYPTLRAQLDALAVRQGDIEFLALNPFHVDEFFLLLRSNTAVFRVAHGCRADVGDLLAKHGITCGPDDPPPAYDDHAPPPS